MNGDREDLSPSQAQIYKVALASIVGSIIEQYPGDGRNCRDDLPVMAYAILAILAVIATPETRKVNLEGMMARS